MSLSWSLQEVTMAPTLKQAIFLLIFASCVVIPAAQDYSIGIEAPRCPADRYTPDMCKRIKFRPCKTNTDCSPRYLCCPNGCGKQCRLGVGKKAGKCPRTVYGPSPTHCSITCKRDSDCTGSLKCCRTKCRGRARGTACVKPHFDKPGRCPAATGPGICAFMCYSDTECPGNKKCCRTGCGGTTCRKPILPPKPGFCPLTGKINCIRQQCKDDHDCKGKKKCCSNNCLCSNPVYY